jgi:hypothetical protein
MLIKIDKNYSYPNIKRQTPNKSGVWKNIGLTENSECDLYVVFNHSNLYDYKIKCRKGGRILIIQEPPYGQKKHFLTHLNDFDLIISHFDDLEIPQLKSPGMLPWFVEKNYDELNKLDFSQLEKENKAIWITSNRNKNPGHHQRLEFLDYLNQKNNPNINVYGKGINPIEDKFSVLSGAKYTIAIENYFDHDYWTEKIMDAYLSLSMPIHQGCKNLDKYFPKESFISIDINNPQHAYDKVCDVLNSNLFEENKAFILEAKDLVLNKYQFFPWIKELIDSGVIKLGEREVFDFYKTSKKPIFKRILNRIFNVK